MFPRPYQMPDEGGDIFSGGQQFGTLPNPVVGPLQVATGGMPDGMSPFAMQMLREYRQRQEPQPGRVEFDEPMQPPQVDFSDPNLQGYMMGRYVNNSNGLDRNMRMRDKRVQQADADNGVDRFFSRVVAPVVGGIGGATGNAKGMKFMTDWENHLDSKIQRNRVFQAQHINDYQQNQQQAFNQAAAMDPRTIKNQRDMMRAYYYGQGVIGRNQHYADSDENKANQIVNQRDHWYAQEDDWKGRRENASRRTDISQQNADTNRDYKRGMLGVNQQNANTRKDLSEAQIRHLNNVDDLAERKLGEVQRFHDAQIDRIYDDIATGAVKREEGMARIDKIHDEMTMKREEITFKYDKLRADIAKGQDQIDQRDRVEEGRNRRFAADQKYDKDGEAQPRADAGFRAEYGKPLDAPSQSRSSGVLDSIKYRQSAPMPSRRESNGLVPPPAAPQVQRRGGGIAAATEYYRSLPESQKAVARAAFIAKYGRSPDAQ